MVWRAISFSSHVCENDQDYTKWIQYTTVQSTRGVHIYHTLLHSLQNITHPKKTIRNFYSISGPFCLAQRLCGPSLSFFSMTDCAVKRSESGLYFCPLNIAFEIYPLEKILFKLFSPRPSFPYCFCKPYILSANTVNSTGYSEDTNPSTAKAHRWSVLKLLHVHRPNICGAPSD